MHRLFKSTWDLCAFRDLDHAGWAVWNRFMFLFQLLFYVLKQVPIRLSCFAVKLQKCFEDYETSPSFPSGSGASGSWIQFNFWVNLYFNGSYSRSRFLKLIFLFHLSSSLHISSLFIAIKCNLKAKFKACRHFNLSAVRENTSSSRYRNDISKSAAGSLSVGVRFHLSVCLWSALMCLCQG